MAQVSVSERMQKNTVITGLEFEKRRLTAGQAVTNHVLEKLKAEGGIDLYNYLCWIGLSVQPNIMVLSSMKHYYYDHSDLKNIGVLISMKMLNQVSHLESFIHTLFRLLPCKSHFVGCYRSTSEEKGNAILRLPSRLFSGLHSGNGCASGMLFTRKSAGNILENNGFVLNDLTDANGITYFWAQNDRRLGD